MNIMYTTPESVKQFFDMLVPAVVNDQTDVITNLILSQCLRLILKESSSVLGLNQIRIFSFSFLLVSVFV